MQKVTKKIMMLVLGLVMIGLAVIFYFKGDRTPVQDQYAKRPLNQNPTGPQLVDREPFESPCAFWEPWNQLVAPESPVTYLNVISEMLVDGAERTSEYIDLIMRDPGVMGALRGDAEEMCIAGQFSPSDKKYRLLADRSKVCQIKPENFLEQNLAIKISPLKEGGFDNHIRYKLHVGRVIPAQFRSFWMGQMELMKKGYRGWTRAFPEYFSVNRNGFGLVHIQHSSPEQPLVGVREYRDPFTEVRLDWLTQAMMSTQIDWATFLLKLGDLAKIDMWSETDYAKDYIGEKPYEGRLLATKIETRLTSVNLQIPHSSEEFFKEVHEVPIIIGHDVIVKFRGIQVLVKGLKYRGTLHSDDSQYSFNGFFDNVENIEITGAYRGLGLSSGVGKMIHNIIQEVIDREIGRLKKGHQGQPAKLRIGLYKDGLQGRFEVEMRFDAAVNILNIVREEKDQVDSPVMPSKKSIKDLNQWAKLTMSALAQDYAAIETHQNCSRAVQ